MKPANWTIQDLWNDTLIEKQREVKPRDYIRASEIGGAFLDRYYKMKGIPFSDPFEARVLRIFETGNIFEWLVKMVLVRSGILVSTQDEVRIKTPMMLDVVGHLDLIGGGKPNFEEAEVVIEVLKQLDFPSNMMMVADKIIEVVKTKFPDGLPPLLYEVKSINSMVFWRGDKMLEKPYPHHELQLYTYLKGKGMKEGRIIYVSKDDLTIAEFAVFPTDELEARWHEDVKTITKHYKFDNQPDAEPPVVWSKQKRKYELNWKLARSNYFTKITGVIDKKEWDRLHRNLVNRANARVKKAFDMNKELTDQEVRGIVDPYIKKELSGERGITVMVGEGGDEDA